MIKLDEIDNIVEQMKERLSALKNVCELQEKTEGKLKEVEEEIEKLNSIEETLSKTIDDLNSKYDSFTSENKITLKEETNSIRTEVDERYKDLSDKIDQIDEKQNHEKEVLSELMGRCRNNEKSIETVNYELTQTKNDVLVNISDLKKSIEKNSKDISSIKNDISGIEKKLIDMNDDLSTYKTKTTKIIGMSFIATATAAIIAIVALIIK